MLQRGRDPSYHLYYKYGQLEKAIRNSHPERLDLGTGPGTIIPWAMARGVAAGSIVT